MSLVKFFIYIRQLTGWILELCNLNSRPNPSCSFGIEKVLGKEKDIKENDSLMFGFVIKDIKENQI